jgi:hypothetical protein
MHLVPTKYSQVCHGWHCSPYVSVTSGTDATIAASLLGDTWLIDPGTKTAERQFITYCSCFDEKAGRRTYWHFQCPQAATCSEVKGFLRSEAQFRMALDDLASAG